MTVNDVDAPYQLNDMDLNDLAVLLNVPKSPLKDDLYDFFKLLTEDKCECLVDGLARCYKSTGLIKVILFKLILSTTEFANILVELLERMKRVLNITVIAREWEAI